MAFKLFGNYNTPGPGVRKDEPEKPPFIRFWQLFFRKFSKLVQLNLLFIVPLIAVFAIIYFINHFIQQPFLFMIPVIFISPFVAGLTYVTRNFAREEHAFVYSDFKETVIKNWKQFLINGMICYVFTVIIYVAIQYYWMMSTKNNLYSIALGLCIMLSCLFVFAQYYIPIMIITFDLKLKQIYKNAFIFAILGLWRNLLLTVILVVLIFAIFVMYYILMPLTMLIASILLILILFAFCSYMINFMVYPLIVKMMIKPYYEKQNAAEKDTGSAKAEEKLEESELPSPQSQAVSDEDDEKKPEYVFVNGKLIKRPLNDDDVNIFNDRF